MTPPNGLPKPLSTPTDSHSILQRTAESLDALSQGCSDAACIQAQTVSGGLYLAQYRPNEARDVYLRMADCAAARNNFRHELLARGLIALSEGRILDAKTNLMLIKDHPYAQELLKLVGRSDDRIRSLQTVFILKALVNDERSLHPSNSTLFQLETFLNEAEGRLVAGEGPELKTVLENLARDPTRDFSKLPETLERLAEGAGGEILRTASLENDTLRARALLAIVGERLLPQHRAGSAYAIAKIFQKHPELGSTAENLVHRFEGLKTDPSWLVMEVIDEGATSYAASLLALVPARWTARGLWALWTSRFGARLPWWQWALGQGIAWIGSTATYFFSEKTLLWASGFDGKIWPSSSEEALREWGADMIVMGLSNTLGIGHTRLSQRLFKPLPPSRWFFQAGRYTLRTPLRVGFWGITGLNQGILLHLNHRWQDNVGLIDRFRPGKPTYFISPQWIYLQQEAEQVEIGQRVLGQLLNHTLNRNRALKTDRFNRRITDLKRWIGELNPAATPAEEEQMLGIFWVAQDCGVLNPSAQDYLLKWVQEGRFDRVNDYFSQHNIPLQVARGGAFNVSPLIPPPKQPKD